MYAMIYDTQDFNCGVRVKLTGNTAAAEFEEENIFGTARLVEQLQKRF